MVLEGFLREKTRETMGTAFSRGGGSNLPPMNIESSLLHTHTQADNLCHEVVVELMDEEKDVWENAAEKGLVKIKLPEAGTMTRIKITGQAIVFVNTMGELVIDSEGY